MSTGKVTRYAQTEKERERIIKEFNVKNLSRPAVQGPRRDERRPALGDDDEPRDADAAARRQSRTPPLADEIFTMLMGEKVAPRKDFIKTEARKVQNLDV